MGEEGKGGHGSSAVCYAHFMQRVHIRRLLMWVLGVCGLEEWSHDNAGQHRVNLCENRDIFGHWLTLPDLSSLEPRPTIGALTMVASDVVIHCTGSLRIRYMPVTGY